MKLRKITTKKIKPESLLKSFYVFDVETTKLEPMSKNFVFGVIYGFNGWYKVIKTISGFKKEFTKKKYNNKIIFAHNAEFDLLTIFGNLYENVDSKTIFNGKFISAKYGKITFADSLNVLLQGVKKIGEKMGIKKMDNSKIKDEQLTKNNITKKDIEYCITDCKIVYEALSKIYLELGSVKITLASVSLYDYRKFYLKKDLYYNEFVYDFYESYYGGRTEAFKLGETNSKVVDVNSLFPYVMAMDDMYFPDVSKLKKEVKVDVKYLMYVIKRFEGMAKISLKHNESYFGFLPYRYDNKLLFPIGNFTTTLNFNEIRFAIDHDIIEIKKVYYIVYGNPVKSPFIEFVLDNYKKRKEAKNAFDDYYYKIKKNALYGRFAMKKKYQDEYYNQIPFEIISELQKTGKFYNLKRFSKDRDDCYLTTINEKMENTFFSIPVFSSYITSGARILLLTSMLENQSNGITYCDTDAIFLEGNFVGNISNDLGGWKVEKKEVLKINGLKNYVYENQDPDSKDYGKVFDLIKGISKDAKKINDKEYRITKYYKTKEALRRGEEAGEQFILTKRLRHAYDKRVVLRDGINTKPIRL